MQLTCRKCGSKILYEDIDIQKVLARCRQCGAEFGFIEMVPNEQQPMAAVKFEVEKPTEFTVRQQQGVGIAIFWRWFTISAFVFLFNMLIWDAVLAGLIWFCFKIDIPNDNRVFFMFFFGTFFLVLIPICLWGTYKTVALFINSTTVYVDNVQIVIRHSPLPWPKNIKIPVESIDQLYCEEEVHVRENIYNVIVLLKSGKKVALISKLKHMNKAAFIEQQIENRLGIIDRPINGEMLWRKG